ncbi:MAG: permease-like cell division protein FtsX [Elusimicrobia bacterium]|nr:permease-like cell division protein FtsX [Elusimicrobiota bacterium]
MNYKKRTLFLNFSISLLVGFFFIFKNTYSEYRESLRKKVFIAVFLKNSSDIYKIQNKIKSIPGVEKTELLLPDEVLTGIKGFMKDFHLFADIPRKDIPSLLKVYLTELNFATFQKISSQISKMQGVEDIDTGGKETKNIFLFDMKLKKILKFLFLFFLVIVFVLLFAEINIFKPFSNSFYYLKERGISKTKILLSHLFELLILPISSTLFAIFFFLVLKKSFFAEFSFLKNWDVFAIFIIAAFPSFFQVLRDEI